VSYKPSYKELEQRIKELEKEYSDRKKAEAALRKNEEFLQNIFDAIQDGISVLDSELNIVMVNAWIQNLYLDDITIGVKKCYEIFKGRYSPCPLCPAVKTLEDGKPHSKSIPFPSLEEPARWLNISTYPLKNLDGQVDGIIEHIREITESRRAEEALRQSEAKYRELVQNANSIILRRNAEGKITFFNEFAQSFFGYTEDEIIGKNVVGTIVPEKDRAGRDLAAMIKDIGFNPEKYAANENENMLKSGERVWVSWTNKAVRNKNGIIHEILCVGNDVTERKQLERQLRHALKIESIGTLAGGIAHDFNNLLMTILGNTSLMLLNTDHGDPNYKKLKTIEKQIESGSKLTSQLLGYARKGTYELKPINLNYLVKNSAEIFGRTRKDISIKLELSPDLLSIEADGNQIEQILWNLYVNAADAMPEGGDFIIKTFKTDHIKTGRNSIFTPKPGKYVLLTVTDTGIGMDKKTQERIFDPFFTTKEMGRGTGLGLASVYGIIKSHNGYIDVESKKGEGTTFSIYLPASEKIVKNTVHLPKTVVKGTETVLLIDDEELVLDVGKDLLETMGYRVLSARDGQEAIEVYKKNQDKIDIIILDMIMPNLSGGKVYDELKEINADVKILLSSGYSIDGQASAILQRGCNGFIHKPFSINELSGKLREILEKKL
jgi:two-component system cell cycle sensor histidine kinase/response regulator CckA